MVVHKIDMNRDIKFRVWDTFTEKMVATGYHVIGETTCFSMVEQWARMYPNLGENWLLRLNDFVEMQYTGLKDKNSKEIYEGDILQDSQGLEYKVIFDENYARFSMEITKGLPKPASYNTQIWESKIVKILGNIFENPSLLTDNN